MSEAAKEISCRVSNTIINFVNSTNPALIPSLISGLPYSDSYLLNTDNWITWDEERMLEDSLARLYGDPRVMFRVGKSIMANKSLGLLNVLFNLFLRPESLYRYTPKWAGYFTKGIVSIKILDSTPQSARVEIRVKGRQTRGACLFNQGMYSVGTALFGLKDARINELQCVMHKHEVNPMELTSTKSVEWGADSCVFDVVWENSMTSFFSGSKSKKAALDDALTQLESNYAKLQNAYDRISHSETRLRNLMDNASDVIILIDSDGIVSSINQKGLELSDYKLEDIVGKGLSEFVTNDSELTSESISNALLTSNSSKEMIFTAKDGRRILLSVNSTSIIEGGEQVGQMLIARDITNEREIAGRLIEAEKYAAKGLVAAEIAHEINNSLANIETGLYIVNNINIPDTYKSNIISDFHDEITRMSSIVRGILDVYHADTVKMQLIDLNQELEKVITFVSRQLRGKGISLRFNFSKNHPVILCHPGHIKQISLNLIKNAADAVSNSTTRAIIVSTSEDTDHVTMKVQDTGCGMPQNMIDKVTNRLFTTKETGTGLGLAISKQLIEQNNGTLHIESRPDHGSVFTVKFRRNNNG